MKSNGAKKKRQRRRRGEGKKLKKLSEEKKTEEGRKRNEKSEIEAMNMKIKIVMSNFCSMLLSMEDACNFKIKHVHVFIWNKF